MCCVVCIHVFGGWGSGGGGCASGGGWAGSLCGTLVRVKLAVPIGAPYLRATPGCGWPWTPRRTRRIATHGRRPPAEFPICRQRAFNVCSGIRLCASPPVVRHTAAARVERASAIGRMSGLELGRRRATIPNHLCRRYPFVVNAPGAVQLNPSRQARFAPGALNCCAGVRGGRTAGGAIVPASGTYFSRPAMPRMCMCACAS